MPVVSPLGWQVTRVPLYVRRPFPSKENWQISERDDLGPPVGVIALHPPANHRDAPSRRTLYRAPGWRSKQPAPPVVESGGIILAVNAGARAPRGGVTRQGVVLTDLPSHLDCQ